MYDFLLIKRNNPTQQSTYYKLQMKLIEFVGLIMHTFQAGVTNSLCIAIRLNVNVLHIQTIYGSQRLEIIDL